MLPLSPSWFPLFFPSFPFLGSSLSSSFSLLCFCSPTGSFVPLSSDSLPECCACVSDSEVTSQQNLWRIIQHPLPICKHLKCSHASSLSSSRASPLHLRHPPTFPNTGTPRCPPLQKYPTRGELYSQPTPPHPLMVLGFQVLLLVAVVFFMSVSLPR